MSTKVKNMNQCDDFDLNKKYYFHYIEKYSPKLDKFKTIQIFNESICLIDFIEYITKIQDVEIEIDKIESSHNDVNMINIYGFMISNHKKISFSLDLSKENDILIIRNFITECLISQRPSSDRYKELEWFLKIGEKNKTFLIGDNTLNYINNNLKYFLPLEDKHFLNVVIEKYANFPNSDSLGIFNINYNFIKKDFFITIIHYNRGNKNDECRQIQMTISKKFFVSSYPDISIQIEDQIEAEDYMAYAISKKMKADFETIKYLLEANQNKFDFREVFESLSINNY